MEKQNMLIAQVIIWSLLMLAALMIAFIVFRIVSRELQKRRLDAIAEKDAGLETACSLIKEAMKEISAPPSMALKVSFDTFCKINDYSNILFEKRLISYRYYKMKIPCLFYADSKTKVEFEDMIEVLRFGKEIVKV